MPLPPRFTKLSSIDAVERNTFHSVIGVVVHFQPPVLVRTGGNFTCQFNLRENLPQHSESSSAGVSVRFFKEDRNDLPPIGRCGDVVLMRAVKAVSYHGQPVLISHWHTRTVIFPFAKIPDPSYAIAFQGSHRIECLGAPYDKESVTLQEQAYVMELTQALSSLINNLPAANPVDAGTQNLPHRSVALTLRPPPVTPQKRSNGQPEPNSFPPHKKAKVSTFGPKFRLVSQLEHFVFSDVCVEVVKKYSTPFGKYELYVTDYTKNEALFYYEPPNEDLQDRGVDRDGDVYGYCGPPKRAWPGPFGYLVLKVNVTEPHASFIDRQVSEGEVVLLQNLKMKMQPDGTKLEGDMWPDNRIKVSRFPRLQYATLPEIHELLQRKDKYWAAMRPAKSGAHPAGPNRKQQDGGGSKPLPPRKKNPKEKKQAGKASVLPAPPDNPAADPAKSLANAILNPHVRCSHEEVNPWPLKRILDPENKHHNNTTPAGHAYTIPFCNAKFRALVRVVDFSPARLADFAQPPPDDDGSASDSSTSSAAAAVDRWGRPATPRWRWSFSLLLEDAHAPRSSLRARPARLWVHLHHTAAQYLLGNDVPDPTGDLGAEPRLLAQLREKLCILWGNLEEVKTASEQGRMDVDTGAGAGEAGEDLEGVSNLAFECCLHEYGVPLAPYSTGDVLAFSKEFAFWGVTIM